METQSRQRYTSARPRFCRRVIAESAKNPPEYRIVRNYLLMLALLAAASGCSRGHFDYLIRESNYLTYEHAFTDAASESARKSAERHCAEKKHLAIQTGRACSLTVCTTHYQCMDREEAARVAPPGAIK